MSGLGGTRQQARKLENDIDSKLVQLSRFGVNASTAGFPQLQREIEALIQQLSDINDRMSREAASGTSGSTATSMHILQRHREILHDFQQDFSRSKANIKAAMERDQLLHSVRQDIREHRVAEARASETLLRERNAIHGADRSADEVLGQAYATRESLASQRGTVLGTGFKLSQISHLAPQVDALLGKIGVRKKRDKAILGIVIGLCAGLLFLSAVR